VRLDERVFLKRSAMAEKAKNCSECGVELRLDPATCPLCGTPTGVRSDWSKPDEKAEVLRFKPTKPEEVDDYQAKLRKLRKSLKELREDARGA
jgi:predicted amidophosphoribosyltransferase